MIGAAATKPCSVCGKAIEEPKHRIHEATCARNNYKCKECGEIVAKADKDHHESEMHAVVLLIIDPPNRNIGQM